MNIKNKDNIKELEKFVTDGIIIIKISNSDKLNHYGYDILNEVYTSIEISKCYKLPKILFDLIKYENHRVKLIYHTAQNCNMSYKANCLNVTERTYYRMISDIGLNCK